MRASVAANSRARALPAVACAAALLVASACAARFDVEATPVAEPTGDPSDSAATITEPPRDADAAETAPGDARVDARFALDAGLRDAAADDADADADAAATRKRVFVTSTTYKGTDLSPLGGAPGALGADVLCAKAASAAGLTGRFDAWISDMSVNAATRLPDPGPFYDVGRRTLLFDKNPALGPPLAAIPDENGVLGVQRYAWTGSTSAGVKLNDCDRWSRTGSMGTVGNASAPASWANLANTGCDTSRRLYCFER